MISLKHHVILLDQLPRSLNHVIEGKQSPVVMENDYIEPIYFMQRESRQKEILIHSSLFHQ